MTLDPERLALEMWEEARREEQSARRVASDLDAETIRRGIRRHARAAGARVRTARMDGTVVAVRLDAAVWGESAAVMRRKLSPGD
jgi:hypothetical protein